MKRNWIRFFIICLIFLNFTGVLTFSQGNLTTGQVPINYGEIHQNIMEEINPGYNEEWFEQDIDMIFVVPDGYENSVQNLSDWKTQKGVPSKIINKSMYMQYDGRDEPEKLRNCIIDYYETYGIQWVLLVGDTDLIPTRYIYNPDTRILREEGSNDHEALGSDIYKPTDYYYADLTGTWDIDDDDIFGESLRENWVEEIEFYPEVNVGRFPGNSISEIETMVNKTLHYDKVQYPGEWMNQMLLGASIQDWPSSSDLDGEQEVRLANKIIEESVEGNINYTLLAESTFYGTNLTQSSFRENLTIGRSIVLFAGHGSTRTFNGINGGSSTTILTKNDAINLANHEMPSLFYADACSTNIFDQIDDSMGENLIKKASGGAIGYIGAMRLSFYYVNDSQMTGDLAEMNRGMTRLFFSEFFNNHHYQQGKALNEMRISYLNSEWLQNNPRFGTSYNIHEVEWERKNVLTYTLLGDPELDIFTQNPKKFKNQTFGLMAMEYEGSRIQKTLFDEELNPVPYARISFQGDNDTYNTFNADEFGNITIQLPPGVRDYNYTITAHNMIPRTGVLHTINDTIDPYFTGQYSYSPGKPTVNSKIRFLIPVEDIHSSITCGVIALSTDSFQNYVLYELLYDDINERIDGILPQLKTGEYSYILFAYDNGQNFVYTTWDSSMIFTIPVSIAFVFILIANIGLVGFVGFFIFKKYRENTSR